MKVRFTFWSIECASYYIANLAVMKKVAKIEEIAPCEINVTFKPGTKYEYIKRAAGNATITLA